MSLIEKIDKNRLPRHVAIIMDGNGRWAKAKGKDRSFGHQEGVVSVRKIMDAVTQLGLKYLTLYTFSTENWNRPEEEVQALMSLLVSAIHRETPDMMKKNVRLTAIGDLSRLREDAYNTLQECIDTTSANTGTTLVLALSYSSRWEITRAARQLAQEVLEQKINPNDITEAMVSDHLTTKNIPDPDLLIRTGGEKRISNFLLWQLSYAEFFFTDVLWPDFREEELYEAILYYQQRERRYMYKRIVLFFICLGFACGAFAQEIDTTQVEAPAEVPVISYSLAPKKYKIADIKITGIKNYDDFVLIGFSGLSVGDEITVPGEEITTAVKRFWKHGLFSDVKILATKIEGDQIWLEIQLKQRPRISQVNYHGIKKGEREDLEAKLGLKKGFQVTPNVMDRAKIVIQKFFDGKGFKNVDVEIEQKDDPANEGEVIVDINIDKNEKTKIHRIYFEGNEKLTARELKKAMKKTNEKFSLPNDWKTSIMEMFSTKKFTTEE